MVTFVLFLLYLGLIFFESMLLYRIFEDEITTDYATILTDVTVVNGATLVMLVVWFGPTLSQLDSTGTMHHFVRVMLVTWPEEIIKMSLFSIVSDALILAGWYYFRYPKLDPLTTALRGALMNVPALIVAGVAWAFVAITYEFLHFIKAV